MNIKTLLVFSLLICSLNTQAQVTRVQFINNCPEVGLPALDIYIDGNLLANDLFFRHSHPYADLPAGTPINIGIAENTSLVVADTFMNRTMTLNQANVYVIVIDGVKANTGYTPLQKVTMHVYNMGNEGAAINFTDALFINGCTDAGTMDIRTGLNTMANDLSYGDFSNNYYSLSSTGNYKFRATNATGSKTTHNFEADYSSFPSFSGKGVVIVGSGFMNPANNSNGEAFGLWVSLPTGGPMTELPLTTEAEQLSRIQLIHNSADTAVGKIDVYIDNQKVIDTLDFRHATEYADIYAGVAMNVGIAKAGSGVQFYNQSITLDSGKAYVAVLNGIESDTNYKPLPPLKIDLSNIAKEEASAPTTTEILYMHGSTDGPLIDIRQADNTPLFTNLAYGDFSIGYGSIAQSSVPVIKVDTGNTNVHLEKYEIKITDWNLAGKTATVVCSGFIEPDSNSGGPAFGLWAALPEGGALRELPVYTSVNNLETTALNIKLYPNPARNEVTFESTSAKNNILVTDVTGKVVMQLNNYTGHKIAVDKLNTGTYIFLLQSTEGELYYAKFQKL